MVKYFWRHAEFVLFIRVAPKDQGPWRRQLELPGERANLLDLGRYIRRRQISSVARPLSNSSSVPGSGTTTLAVKIPGWPAKV